MQVNNYEGFLLWKLSEECTEVSHAVHKVMSFGMGNGNWEKTIGEIKDVLATIECMHDNKILSADSLFDEKAFHRKKVKISRSWKSAIRTNSGWKGSAFDVYIPTGVDSRQMCFDFED